MSLGLRPFFLVGALHEGLIVVVWLPWFLGFVSLPAALPPLAWHAHELLVGFVLAIVAGFLLTAVPSWTGRAPLIGVPLAMLLLIWKAGRAAIVASAGLDPLVIATCALSFPIALTAFLCGIN